MFSAQIKLSINGYIRFCSGICIFAVVCTLMLFTAPALAKQLSLTDRFAEAQHHYYLKEYDKSLEILAGLSARVCSPVPETDFCIRILTLKSNVFRNQQDISKSEEFINRALNLLDNSMDVEITTELSVYVQKSYLQYFNSDINEAFIWAEKAMILSEEHTIKGIPKAVVFQLTGTLNDANGNYNEAILNYREALQILESVEQTLEATVRLTQAHNNIGISYRRLGRIDDAKAHFQKNLALVRETFGSNHLELSYSYNSIGSLHYMVGDFATAGDYFERSGNIIRSYFGDTSLSYATTLNNAGLSYYRLGDYSVAATILEQAQRIKETVLGKEHEDTAIGYSNLASIYIESGDYDEALKNYQLSISVRKSVYDENHPTLAIPYMQLGAFYITINEYEKARESLREALRITETRIGDTHPNIWEIHTRIGNSYLKEQNPDEAAIHFEKALDLIVSVSGIDLYGSLEWDAISHPLEFMNVLKALGDVSFRQFQINRNTVHLDDAEFYYTLSADAVAYLQSRYQSEASKLNLIEKNYEIYTNAFEVFYNQYLETDEQLWLQKMFLWSEQGRSRIALELLQGVEARNFSGVPEDVMENERRLNVIITNYYRMLHTQQERGFEADDDHISAYRDSLFYAKQDLHEFTLELERNYPSYYDLKYDNNPVTLQQAQHLLGSDETLLSYMFTKKNLYMLIITRNSIAVSDLGPGDQIPQIIESLRDVVIYGKSGQFPDLSRQLYDKLIAPVAAKISSGSLIIVPDNVLHFLPFELLLTDHSNHSHYHQMPFLVRQRQISYAPSVTMLQKMKERHTANPRNLLALAPFNQTIANFEIPGSGVERYAGNLTPLPLTRYETSEIAKLFRQRRSFMDYFFPEKADVFLDRDASKQRLTSASLEEYSYIHFAAHAFVNETNPEFSGIVLWGDETGNSDGIVYVSDIYNLNMKANLVVLGACETGLGTMLRGEGIIGFTRAFIYAGASNLVVSKWRVSDQPTSKLMIHFYDFIKSGHSYSEALQLAKLELINHPEYAAPVNWAAFVLQGR